MTKIHINHLFLKAVQLLEQRDTTPPSIEETAKRIRLAFFRDGRDVGNLDVLRDLALELRLPHDAIFRLLINGEAMAALSTDAKRQEQYRVEGSPTYVLNEGRQKLYGNIGYRILEANVQELFDTPAGRASWC